MKWSKSIFPEDIYFSNDIKTKLVINIYLMKPLCKAGRAKENLAYLKVSEFLTKDNICQ